MAAVVAASASAAVVHSSASVAPAVVQSAAPIVSSVAVSTTHTTLASVAPVASAPAVSSAAVVSASVSHSVAAVQSVTASHAAPSTTAKPASSSTSHKPTSTSSSATGTSTAGASTGSSATRGMNNGAIIAICVILGVCSLLALFAIRRCIRRRQTNKETQLPPPNTSFFQPYWRSSRGSANNTLNQQRRGFLDEETNSMKHEGGYNMPLHYSDRSGPPSESSRTDSWRKSLGDAMEMGHDMALDSRSGTMTMVQAPSPLGATSPLVPPATISDPFLSSSPNSSLVSLPTPPDHSALNTDLTSSPTNLTPSEEFPPSTMGSPRPGTNDPLPPRTESPRLRAPNTSQSRRARSPLEEHSRRQSTHSMASTAGYAERRNSVIRGPPHKSNMQIVLPQPLAYNLASTLVDPAVSSRPPSAYANRNLTNRRSRADIWAETLSRSHTPAPPSVAGHGEETQPSRRGRKSGDSEESRGELNDRPRSRAMSSNAHFVHPEQPPPLPEKPTAGSRSGTPAALTTSAPSSRSGTPAPRQSSPSTPS